MASVYTEFYCDPAQSNLNAGSTTGAASVTSTNGDWGNAAANRFTAAGGATPFTGVAVGEWASVFLDAATVAVYVARITAVDAGGTYIELSTTAKSGTAPASGANGRTCKVGGAWKGPNGTESFPFGFVTAAQMDASSNPVRVNIKGGTNYAITAAMTHNIAGPVRFQGYTTTVGDGGKATIDGTIVGASYIPLSIGASASNTDLEDIIIQNNGTTGTAAGLSVAPIDCFFRRVVVNNVRGTGYSVANLAVFVECEAYACNLSNTANLGGFNFTTNGIAAIRCIAHDNSGSNNMGFRVAAFVAMNGCIADTNGKAGFEVTTSSGICIANCVAFNNVTDGILINAASATSLYIENCILTKNGTGGTGYGINLSGAVRDGAIVNCAFGAGTQANATGQINNLSGAFEQGTITLAADLDPFSAASTGNFNVTAATVKGTGRGSFTETQASYTGTVSYPDVGASQHQESAGGGLMRNPSLSGGTV